MITLKQLKWNNCFSYGSDNELDYLIILSHRLLTNGIKSSIPLIIEEIYIIKIQKA